MNIYKLKSINNTASVVESINCKMAIIKSSLKIESLVSFHAIFHKSQFTGNYYFFPIFSKDRKRSLYVIKETSYE